MVRHISSTLISNCPASKHCNHVHHRVLQRSGRCNASRPIDQQWLLHLLHARRIRHRSRVHLIAPVSCSHRLRRAHACRAHASRRCSCKNRGLDLLLSQATRLQARGSFRSQRRHCFRDPSSWLSHDLTYVINLVRTKHDNTVRRGALVKAMAIGTRYPFIEIFKPALLLALDDYFREPGPDCLARLYESINRLDLSAAPSFSRAEKLVLRGSDRRDLFEERFVAAPRTDTEAPGLASAIPADTVETARSSPTATNPVDAPRHRKDSTSTIASETRSLRKKLSAASLRQPLGARRGSSATSINGTAIGQDRRSNPYPSSPLPATSRPRDTHFFDTVLTYSNVPLPIRVPLTTFPEEVGEYSLIRLIQTFSGPQSTPTGPVHPHLHTNGPSTHPIIVLFNALITQKRVIFLGYGQPANLVASFVLAACALGSGCGVVLQGFAARAFPTPICSISTTSKGCRLHCRCHQSTLRGPSCLGPAAQCRDGSHPSRQGYRTGLTAGRRTIAGAAPIVYDAARGVQACPRQTPLAASRLLTVTRPPMQSLLSSVCCQLQARMRFQTVPCRARTPARAMQHPETDPTLPKTTRVPTLATPLHGGAAERHLRALRRALHPRPRSRICLLLRSTCHAPRRALLRPNLTCAHLPAFPQRSARIRTQLRRSRCRDARDPLQPDAHRRVSFHHRYGLLVEELNAHGGYTRAIRDFDVAHQIGRLRRARKLFAGESDLIFETIARSVVTHDQIVELLALLPPHTGGLLPLALGLFHPNQAARDAVVDFFLRLCRHPVGRKFVQSMHTYHRSPLPGSLRIGLKQRWQGQRRMERCRSSTLLRGRRRCRLVS